jgi:hypothetical protein
VVIPGRRRQRRPCIGRHFHEIGGTGIFPQKKQPLPKPVEHRRNPGHGWRRARYNYEEFSGFRKIGIAKHRGRHVALPSKFVLVRQAARQTWAHCAHGNMDSIPSEHMDQAFVSQCDIGERIIVRER